MAVILTKASAWTLKERCRFFPVKTQEQLNFGIQLHLYFYQNLRPEPAIRILQALCLHFPKLGYHQPFAYLVCHSMKYLESEEDVFWLVARLLDTYGLSSWFQKDSNRLFALVDLMQQLVEKHIPALAGHFVPFDYAYHLHYRNNIM